MKVKFENAYSDGHKSTHFVDFDFEPMVAEIDNFWEQAYADTGDGHGLGTKLGSCYTATIVEADDPDLVGLSTEWVD